MSKAIPEITLNDGLTLPVIGLGTYKLKGNEGVNSIQSAIDSGYRLLDTAYNYENEGTVGEAVLCSSVPREELRITSKLPGRYWPFRFLNLHLQHDSLKIYQSLTSPSMKQK